MGSHRKAAERTRARVIPSRLLPLPMLTIVVVLAILSTASCGDGSLSPSVSPTSAIPASKTEGATVSSTVAPVDSVALIGDGLFVGNYTSLKEMARVYGEVVAGTVVDVLLPFDPRPGYKGLTVEQVVGPSPKSDWTPSPEEMERPPGRNYTVYSVQIDTVNQSGSAKVGDKIAVLQVGGLFDGTAYETEGDPILKIGQRYLMFLQPYPGLKEIGVAEPWGSTFSGPAFARFFVDDAGLLLTVDNAWLCEDCTGPRTLHGKSLDEGTSLIQLAVDGKLGDVDLAPAVAAPSTAPEPVITPAVTTDARGQPTIAPGPDTVASPTPPADLAATPKER